MTQWRTLDPSLVFDVGSVAVAWLPRWLGHKKKENIFEMRCTRSKLRDESSSMVQ